MTQKQITSKKADWKALLVEDPDFLKVLVREILQEAFRGRWKRRRERARASGPRRVWATAPGITREL
jgi:hypothetical protein